MNIASLPTIANASSAPSDRIIREMQENNDELEQSLTPKQSLQKRLIEAMFYKDKDKKSDNTLKTPYEQKQALAKADTVTISQQAFDLQASQKTEATVTIKNADGSTVTVSIVHEERLRIQAGSTQEAPKSADPLIIDLDGNGVQLTDVTKGNGVQFDINGDNKKEQVSWVSANDGILAYDKNQNNVIDNGKELFGDQNGAVNGFEELANYDSDNNGAIDKNDVVFSDLYIWQDKNQDGVSATDELKKLDDYGIIEINLGSTAVSQQSGGNAITAVGSYSSSAGSGIMAEAFLNYYG